MSQPFIGMIALFPYNFAPRGWAFCYGQILSIAQNTALFSLLGTTYGGNGQTTFALPNLQGRAPMHMGNGHLEGESSGEQAHTLNTSEMPAHTHIANASSSVGNDVVPANNVLGSPLNLSYRPADSGLTTLN